MRNLALISIAAFLATGCPLQTPENEAASKARTMSLATSAVRVDATIVYPSELAANAAGAPIYTGRDPAKAQTTAQAAPLASPRGAYNDANADGRSDLVWIGEVNGALNSAHWLMDGARFVRTLGPSALGNSAVAISTGDFDGDRRVDQIWLSNNGTLTLGRLNEAGWYEERFIAQVGEDWLFDRSADLNGDGRSDIVWINYSKNLMAYWLMNGTSILRTGAYTLDAVNYGLTGVGDFDGDGREDLLWRGYRSHVLYLWRSRSDGNFDQQYVSTVGADWVLDAVADLNGDARSDLVWANRELNLMAYWWMNGTAAQRTGVINTDTQNYQIGAWGDFDGDGKGDLVWVGRGDENGNPSYLWRGRGDGTFESIFIATYDGGTWTLMPPYADS
ncbi:FG-GAP repeat domain-containing protein [Lysobacter sp. cf310]|uniref:FG-GAP repeat domain-containing protein n=1 Tax=Lysobacter sp. cf310 TaxID=1761790 RepID=UPI0008F14EC9|nr:VCBS repeat-containing protein [Lysobacter sp. cf310]SFK45070.1 Repeat domain-containing protein [Lysobacter sp. cf310]